MPAEATPALTPLSPVSPHAIASLNIDELKALDRSLLHLFVTGPGYGEGLALALPGSGWVLIDSCHVSEGGPRPQEAILARFQGDDDPVLSLILTHPHKDHVLGFADLVRAASPEEIGVTGNPPPEPNLLAAVERELTTSARRTSEAHFAKAIHLAVEAIRSWELKTARKVRHMREHEAIKAGNRVAILCIAPDEEGLRDLMAEAGAAALPRKANHLSLVFEIMFGGTRLLVTSDLPRVESTKQQPEVPTGWTSVMKRHPRISVHHGIRCRITAPSTRSTRT